jgi:hypothetical protein
MESTHQPKKGSAKRPADESGNSKKRSVFVKLGITAAVAVGLRWCFVPPADEGRREAQRCVGDDGRVVVDRYCEDGSAYGFHWYYGGEGYHQGEFVRGGGYNPGVNPKNETAS